MEERRKRAKMISILSALLGIGLALLGAIRAFRGDSLALGEDGLIGVGIALLGQGISKIYTLPKEEEEEAAHDEGL